MANAYDFKFVADVGTTTYICAQSRKRQYGFIAKKKVATKNMQKNTAKLKIWGE